MMIAVPFFPSIHARLILMGLYVCLFLVCHRLPSSSLIEVKETKTLLSLSLYLSNILSMHFSSLICRAIPKSGIITQSSALLGSAWMICKRKRLHGYCQNWTSVLFHILGRMDGMGVSCRFAVKNYIHAGLSDNVRMAVLRRSRSRMRKRSI